MGTVIVRIVNTYSDGHESTEDVEIEGPEDIDHLDDWWQDDVYEHTGDGHAADRRDLGWCYEATIIKADEDILVGQNYEWIG